MRSISAAEVGRASFYCVRALQMYVNLVIAVRMETVSILTAIAAER